MRSASHPNHSLDMLSTLQKRAATVAAYSPCPWESPPPLGDATNAKRSHNNNKNNDDDDASAAKSKKEGSTAAATVVQAPQRENPRVDGLYLARTPAELRSFTLQELRGLLKASDHSPREPVFAAFL